MAGARLGMAFANPELINYLNKFKAPYNLNSLTINAALKRMNEQVLVKNQVKIIFLKLILLILLKKLQGSKIKKYLLIQKIFQNLKKMNFTGKT